MANTTGKKFGGRQKGTPNKATSSAKAALIEAFDNMGGIESLQAWGKDNPGEFYKIWSKLIPSDVKLDAVIQEMVVGVNRKRFDGS